VIEVVDRVKQLLPQLTASLPASVEVATLTDRTVTIRASVKDVQFELMLAVALVVMVIFLFLRTAAGTLIPSIAVPLSLVGTFGIMYLAGFSVNNLTLDGAHHRHRVRRGRRDRDDREHRALRRGRHAASAGGSEGRRADRLHHHLADVLSHCGADPAALHGGRGGAAVPRVRDHARGRHPDLGGRVAHPDADDVRQAPAAQARGRTGRVLPRRGGLHRRDDRALRRDAQLGARPADGDLVGLRRHVSR